MQYEDLPALDRGAVAAALDADDAPSLRDAVLAAALYSEDLAWAEALCLRLAGHKDAVVRGNAVLGLGHLARRFGTLESAGIKGVVQAALADPERYVRGQAEAAADDIEYFTGERITSV